MKILVTGSTGFVGSALTKALEDKSYDVVRAVRQSSSQKEITVGNINADTDWSKALENIETVVHLAARVQNLDDASDQLAAYRKTNTQGTLALARAAEQAGVKRFVFLSSIKAMGEGKNTPYSESDIPAPEDPYGISKWEAEQGLQSLSGGKMEIVILRPPLVYGAHVGANFLRLLGLAECRFPLPFGAIRNKRSMIYIGNLVDAITRCVEYPSAAGKMYLVSDGSPASVPELLRMLAGYMGGRVRMFPVPVIFLQCAGMLLGRQKEVQRITESLIVDDGKIRAELNWRPPFTLEEGLGKTVEWYRTR